MRLVELVDGPVELAPLEDRLRCDRLAMVSPDGHCRRHGNGGLAYALLQRQRERLGVGHRCAAVEVVGAPGGWLCRGLVAVGAGRWLALGQVGHAVVSKVAALAPVAVAPERFEEGRHPGW